MIHFGFWSTGSQYLEFIDWLDLRGVLDLFNFLRKKAYPPLCDCVLLPLRNAAYMADATTGSL